MRLPSGSLAPNLVSRPRGTPWEQDWMNVLSERGHLEILLFASTRPTVQSNLEKGILLLAWQKDKKSSPRLGHFRCFCEYFCSFLGIFTLEFMFMDS